jgi:hypothetical protein
MLRICKVIIGRVAALRVAVLRVAALISMVLGHSPYMAPKSLPREHLIHLVQSHVSAEADRSRSLLSTHDGWVSNSHRVKSTCVKYQGY